MKKRSHGKKIVAIATVMALAVSLSQVQASTPAEPNQNIQYTIPALGKVSISSAANFELLNVQELEQTTDKIVSFTLRLNNAANSGTLNFRDYWVRLKAKNGNTFTVNQISESKEKDSVPAGTHHDFQFYAKVSKTTQLSDLQFNLIKWDFSQSNFEHLLGTISVPNQYKKSVPVNRSYTVISDKTSFKTLVKRVAVGKNDKNFLPSISVVMENAGTQSVTGLNVQFQLRTKNGLFYPLKSAITETTVFNPLEKKELLLTGTIPVEAGEEGWQLVLTQSITNDKGTITVPLASYDLPASKSEEVSIGSEQTFSTKDGTYTAVLTNLTRVPWEDQDILISNVSLKNTGTTPLPVPTLQGRYKLDEVVDSAADIVQFDRVLAIAPGSEIDVQFVSKIPYTYDFQKVALYLEEKAGQDAPATELLRFHHSSELMSIPSIILGGTHTIEAIGKRAALAVKQIDSYLSPSAKLVTATIDATNLEKRYTQAGKFVGQFKTADGAVYPAAIVKPSMNVAPNGKALLSFQANVPMNVDTNRLQLLLGEAVETTATPSQGTAENPTTTAYVNAVVFDLPKESAEPKDQFKELNLYPYKISFEKFGTQLDFTSNEVVLEFNYTLERDFMVEAETKDRAIVVEIEDNKTGFKLSHELKLDDGKTGDGTNSSTNNLLELGSYTMKLTKVDADIKYELSDLKNYKLNIYDQVKPGYKKLIATKELRWFTYSD